MRRRNAPVYSPPKKSDEGRKGSEAGKGVKTWLAGRREGRWGAFGPLDQEAAQGGLIGQMGLFTRPGNDAETGAVGAAVEHAGVGQAIVHLFAAPGEDLVRRPVEFIFPSDEN